jgi:hypothetical protein
MPLANKIIIPISEDYFGYNLFLQCKKLASYRVVSREVHTDDISYSQVFGGNIENVILFPSPHLLDFQKMIAETALKLRRYAAFLDCGLGKTPIELAWAHSVATIGKVLFLCPLSVYEQMQRECLRWYGHRMVDLRKNEKWTDGIAICNFEGRRNIDMTNVIGVVLDEASILKNDNGETRNWIIELSKNCTYRLCASATPAPNDQEEYASQVVFLGMVRSSKEFYSKFFRKDNNKWVLKGWSGPQFYNYLSSWCTYIKSPKSLGFDCMTELQEEPEYIYEYCGMQSKPSPELGLFPTAEDGKYRSKVMGALRTDKESERTKKIIEFATGHKTIIWCARNEEEKILHELLDNSVVIHGATPVEKRIEYVDDWRSGKIQHLISKPSVLGFGINLPECERMVFSGYTYSFEQFYQAIRRGHRYGRVGRLQVLIPHIFEEMHIVNVLKKKIGTFNDDVIKLQNEFFKSRICAE